jgi:hypothetical protein
MNEIIETPFLLIFWGALWLVACVICGVWWIDRNGPKVPPLPPLKPINYYPRPRRKEQGAILLTTVFLCLILGFTMASYLSFLNSDLKANFRSQVWNGVLPIAEGGIEEALTVLNQYADSTNNNLNDWKNVAEPQGWDRHGNVYSVNRTLGDGSYSVSFECTGNGFDITSIGSQPFQSDTISRTVIVSVIKTNSDDFTNGVYAVTNWSEQ